MNSTELIEFDRKHIWHPYTSMTNPLPCYPVKKAKGVKFELDNGRTLIDGMSSWWCTVHGYNHPVLNEALKAQVDNMSHIMFGGITHSPAVDLAQKLIDIVPAGLDRIFFCDSGSVSVEVAMKMAIQYWYSLNRASKCRFITIKNGYHGDTWHAMSVCDPVNGMHHIFSNSLPLQYFVPAPKSGFYDEFDATDLNVIKQTLEKEHSNIAAFILEPIVQGAGGMRFYHPTFLKKVKEICDEYNILLIADEIATGFGRTGKLFACEYANISPDILCLGKAITGGYMSFAATLCTTKVAETISLNNSGLFMHGPTFMANPLACSVANASIDLLMKSNWQANVQRIEKHLKNTLPILQKVDMVQNVRILGAIGVVELKEPVRMEAIQAAFVEEGVWLRPFGKLVYTMPPFIITDNELLQVTNAMIKVVTKLYEDAQ